MKKHLSVLLGFALVVLSFGCGTIMYPQREGQRGGRIDAGVAVMDGIGLLFFILPGVVAFAVDFANGTIYLPPGAPPYPPFPPYGIRERRFSPAGDEKAAVEAAVLAETGRRVDLAGDDVRVVPAKSPDELPALFAAAARP
ncbi:MAG: hypothetical protein ACHQ49_09690 [Elusimicrobiota bacterium]